MEDARKRIALLAQQLADRQSSVLRLEIEATSLELFDNRPMAYARQLTGDLHVRLTLHYADLEQLMLAAGLIVTEDDMRCEDC